MEAGLHYFFTLVVKPWLAGESRRIFRASDGNLVCRYTSRIRWLFFMMLAPFFVGLIVTVVAIHGPELWRGLRIFSIVIAFIGLVWAYTAFYQIRLEEEVLIIRRLLRFKTKIRLAEIASISLDNRGFEYHLVTVSGKKSQVSRFVCGIDILVETIRSKGLPNTHP